MTDTLTLEGEAAAGLREAARRAWVAQPPCSRWRRLA
jgi:hypothetical protein